MPEIPTLDYPKPLPPNLNKSNDIDNLIDGLNTTLEKFNAQRVAITIDNLAFKAENYNLENLDDFRLKNIDNPNLAQDYQERQILYNQQILSNTSSNVADKLSQNLNRLVEKTYQDNIQWVNQNKIIKTEAEVQSNIDHLNQYAYLLGNKGTLNEVINKTTEIINNSREIMMIPEKNIKNFYSESITSYLLGLAKENPNDALNLLNNETLKTYLSGEKYINVSRQIENMSNSSTVQRTKNAENILGTLEKDVLEGHNISGTHLQSSLFATLASGNAELLQKYNSIYDNVDALNSLNLSSVTKMREVQANVKNPYLNNLISKKIATQEQALNQDSLNYAAAQGLSIGPITNFSDANQLRKRISDVEAVNSIFQAKGNIFFANEREQLKDTFNNMTSEVRLEMGLKLASGLNQYTEQAFKEINLTDDLVQTIYFAHNDYSNAKNIATNIITGQQIINDQKPKNMNQLISSIRQKISGTLPIKFENAAIDRIAALYYQKAFVKGNTLAVDSDYVNDSIVENSIEEALGSEPIEYRPPSRFIGRLFGNKSRVLPPMGITGNDFKDGIDNLKDNDLQTFSITKKLPQYLGKEVGAEFIKNNAYFENVAPNAYRLLVRNGIKTEYLMSGNQQFILRLDKSAINMIKNRYK